ncbi:hypothetical protein SAMN05216410_0318 [Sanguibacter gelidistatuariae]|uniref:Uncharacterized protein n=1 Tax=Sanguibacter gelidistatuariae TaxID=1814289 RepID=A0A1G6GNJ1_9MICO|nr:hypothetical protein [Sanguibacter gelidistatuariae]SDB83508.1 hypothetical protein SAMN05216410_0318 [Sanguibacter gelidistatuariae]
MSAADRDTLRPVRKAAIARVASSVVVAVASAVVAAMFWLAAGGWASGEEMDAGLTTAAVICLISVPVAVAIAALNATLLRTVAAGRPLEPLRRRARALWVTAGALLGVILAAAVAQAVTGRPGLEALAWGFISAILPSILVILAVGTESAIRKRG